MTGTTKLDLDTLRVLIKEARHGNSDAQSDLAAQLNTYMTMMSDRHLARDVRANINPSDIVQRSLINMVDGIENFQGESKPEFYGWINRIIKNNCLKVHRDLTRMKRDVRKQRPIQDRDHMERNQNELRDPQLTPQSNAISNERIKQLHEVLSRLPESYSKLIQWCKLDGLSIKEAAESLGLTIDATQNRLRRALIKFEKEWKAISDESQA